MQKQEIICFPDSQELMVLDGFNDNCRLVNGEKGLEIYGTSAYLVDMEWLHNTKPLPEEPDVVDCDCVYDDELIDLGLL